MAQAVELDTDTRGETSNALDVTASFKVLITGFGPFKTHTINPSWEAVSLLPDRIPNTNIEIVKEQIQVSYNYVDVTVPALWKKYNPDLVIHVGVSDMADKITLEVCGHRDNYASEDIYRKLPPNLKCKAAELCQCTDSIDVIKTALDVESLVKEFQTNKANINQVLDIDISRVDVCVSSNAGRYLCEYIYYTSLCLDNNRCLFIHVPTINSPYSLQELTQSLLCIIYIISQGQLSK
ncbi:pyroglutamyl-peptidase 1 [Diaphorina citri]|jgi:Pyrrolidone-carboxylate peptidase (N-terminal pyroglutamyl peptidase)|uniref:Pyroglutamyl-peptidase 1 n=1 Tax=Diaphorina citri TaxID=121845 RepID=A0A1S4E7I5_DIACI|nr:pyroglutamyl-peptidase 1 [Diaphorina citri]XP_008468561.1 pyroglutamyl-peptidase 1 [Diaphorina citri]XP_017298151.1 pyroglutamyl-peptidase 1 [Diaphorina citri]XP_026676967.1 pyroglutamyl-peptidase 1 [Diaphorina citri]KAI5697557.1 hypothetical protein M8J75_012212 [Diaphorina citri]KAI5720998.1 hypothetical protein M8J77_014435 [Diaphorina citri]